MDDNLYIQIEGFISAYMAFEKGWITYLVREDCELVNFKRKRIKDLEVSSSAGLELMAYVTSYRQYIAQHLPSSINMYLDSIGIKRTRVKENLSLTKKIEKNIELDKNETQFVYIIRCVNDIFGARVIVNHIDDFDEVVTCLKNKFPNVRVTNATKSTGYKAIHIYTNPVKGSLPWELQIWQACDEENNTNLHAEYKRGYIKEIKDVKEVNS